MEISFSTFKNRTTQNVNKLSLEKDEQARVCFVEEAPRLVYVHNFETVIPGEDGKPIIEQDGTWPDGKPRERVKTAYAGKFRCLGDDDAVQKYGTDAESCPACKAHIENPNAVKAPVMRILGHVIKYNTKPGSFTPATPFGGSVLVWDLTARRFEQLQAIYEEHGSLLEHDLLLGPCENKKMQKFTIQVGGKAAWKANKENEAWTQVALENGRSDDLESVAGKLPSEFEMEAKVKEVVRAYNHAYGISAVGSTYESLINSEAPASSPATPPAAEEQEKSDPAPFESSAAAVAPATASPASPVEEVVDAAAHQEKAAVKDVTVSLDDLLKM